MDLDLARQLYETGRSHALSAELLYRASFAEGEALEVTDLDKFAFNGTYSLSVHYLLGLGLELMLKAAIVASDGPSDDGALRAIGHDLLGALDFAERHGFISEAPHLRDILGVLQDPFKQHWFRYGRPDQFNLPGDFTQVVAMLEVLHDELASLVWSDSHP